MEAMGIHAGSQATVAPGAKASKSRHEESDEEKLDEAESTVYRAIAARANYLSLDRPDIQFSAKEACRRMASPCRADWARLKHIARYLAGRPRIVYKYDFQEAEQNLCVYSDTDFAGCLETRKSTSGGLILHGQHCIKT